MCGPRGKQERSVWLQDAQKCRSQYRRDVSLLKLSLFMFFLIMLYVFHFPCVSF